MSYFIIMKLIYEYFLSIKSKQSEVCNNKQNKIKTLDQWKHFFSQILKNIEKEGHQLTEVFKKKNLELR